MNKEDELLIQRIGDLAERSYNNNQYTFTNFLSVAELSAFYESQKEFAYAKPAVWGGCEVAERCMIRFGDAQEWGYEEDFPIAAIEIKPLQEKFADNLNHRDFLGALMNLGIKREMLGDIFVKGNAACVFCVASMAEYIVDNLTRIKHTSIMAKVSEDVSDITKPDMKEMILQVASQRVDAVIAKTYNMSRNTAVELFPKSLVFINGRICTENAKPLKQGDTVSVRGFGKLRYDGETGISKKGKLNCRVWLYT